MNSICIITSKYPNKYNTTALVFVQQLTWGMADLGIKCTVICPIPANIDISQGLKLPFKTTERTTNGAEVTVYFPRYIGFGQQDLKFMNTASLTLEGFSSAVIKVVKSLKEKPDVLYGHFISPSGVTAARIGRALDIPAYFAYGESSPWSINNLGLNKVIKELKSISGVIAVSTKNKNELVNLGVIEPNKIEVFPNAIRAEHFYPRDKYESRKKFNLPLEKFIVAFVGHFIERKGIDKVIKAVGSLDGVYGIYAGKGPISPNSSCKTLYSGLVDPNDLPWFYSAADVFVLPTQNEGCCNAIIEAMACGLPIISSDKEFNYDILNKDSALLIDQNNQKEIISSISKILNNPSYKKKLKVASLNNSKGLNYNQRVKRIFNWIVEKNNKIVKGK